MKKLNQKLFSAFKGKKIIRVTTKAGTNLSFSIEGRTWISDHAQILRKKDYGNLPGGELFIAPLEGSAEGVYVIDGSLGITGKVDKHIIVKIKGGQAVSIAGGKEAVDFAFTLTTDKHRNVAEFGIGTNEKAKISGNVLEDEKVLSTCHIALGNNIHFGGKVDVPYHVDGVLLKPTIYADGKLIMKNGQVLV